MGKYPAENWDKLENNKNFLETADIIIPQRQRLVSVLVSYVRFFGGGSGKINLLDLGCGDGILAENVHLANPSARITACDASPTMLDQARIRLKHIKDAEFLNYSFTEIMENPPFKKSYDFIVSSLAIHHLEIAQKLAFFKMLYGVLAPGGHFLNLDSCITADETLLPWYYRLWREWILEAQAAQKSKEDYSTVPETAPQKPENHYQDLNEQLAWLRQAGFANVDCFYKYGIFCLYGGRRHGAGPDRGKGEGAGQL
jgi:tRNA (cmo5U34)-methyltransferase